MAPRRGRARRPGRLTLSRRALASAVAWPAFALSSAAPARSRSLGLRAQPLPLSEVDTPPERLGKLRFMGALDLGADDPGFGGFSGMVLAPDLAMQAVSDRGLGLEASLVLDDRGILTGLAAARLFPLRTSRDRPLGGGRWGDAEALAPLPDGDLLIGFERRHRIMRHMALDGPGRVFPSPPGLAAAPANGALESLAVLDDGRVFALAERLRGGAAGTVRGWIGAPDGSAWRAIDYRVEEGFVPVDAAGLPDGGVLVLERSFSWLGGMMSRIVRLDAASLDTATLSGEEIARLAPPLLAENFEAIAVAPAAAGGLHVALLSDDNFSPFQRTLLLLFRLE